MISQDRLLGLFYYCPRIGGLFYTSKYRNYPQGSRYGNRRKDGYRTGSIDSTPYLEHRLIWVYHHGQEPKVIDHTNRDHTDNRIENLRNVTQVENCRNQKLSRNNKSGTKGVCFIKEQKVWKAYYTLGAKHKSLGVFVAKEDAIAARLKHEKESNWYEKV